MAVKAEQAILQNSEMGYFDIWKAAIEERTGVQITADRERALALLLNRRMVELDLLDVDEYLNETLDVTRGAKEWSGLVDSLLVKETSFFATSPPLTMFLNGLKRPLPTRSLSVLCGYGASAVQQEKNPILWQ